ncbi:MAG: sulfite exporter TauE/SafE family protein [Magnetococcales bacterium]|nr:sulfite exporter TauE/SafE family protein [Magnetococcales bacterium]
MEQAWSELAAIFLGGVLTSAHCVGMCGGLIGACALGFRGEAVSVWRWRMMAPHLLYTLGRVGTYVALGAMAGLAGTLVSVTGRMVGIGGLVYGLAGLVMIVIGLTTLDLLHLPALDNGPSGWMRRAAGRLMQAGSVWRALPLGMLSGLLPCTMHWGFQAQAAASGSMIGGMLVMLAFGLGTAGPLLLFGLFSSLMSARLRRWMLRLAGGLLVWFGLKALIKGWGVFTAFLGSVPLGG